MINLRILKAYLQQNCMVTLKELSELFQVAPDTLRPVLELHFVHKERLVQVKAETHACGNLCGACSLENGANRELYYWRSKPRLNAINNF